MAQCTATLLAVVVPDAPMTARPILHRQDRLWWPHLQRWLVTEQDVPQLTNQINGGVEEEEGKRGRRGGGGEEEDGRGKRSTKISMC